MRLNFTRKKAWNLLRFAPAFLAFCFFTGNLNAQTYVNGGLTTGATTLSGVAAPAGSVWSECQHLTGNTTVTNTTLGSAANPSFTLADDFTVPAGQTWTISKMYFYFVQAAQTPTSPITNVRVQIHNGNPSLGPTTIVFGDLTTNRLASTGPVNAFRINNTVAPPPGVAPFTTIPVWEAVLNVNAVLAPGTYWVEFASGVAGQFAVPSTIVGTRTQAGVNALQKTVAGNVWGPLNDDGVPAGNPARQDVHFKIDYTTGPCSGTPAPGNTISSAAAACPTVNFTLSLQNPTFGTGVSYQWQSSATGVAGSFTNIGGATNSTLTTSQTAATYYQCVVTCSAGPTSGTSTPVLVNLNAPSSCYCAAGATSTSFEKISRIQFGTINNPSTSTAGYENFTAISTNAIKGETLPFTATIAGGFSTDQIKVWIDFNQNGSFSDAGEEVYVSATGVGPHSGNITISSGALTGATRMRVRLQDTDPLFGAPNNATPCGNSGFGQVEDYTINIQPCVQGVFTVVPANKSVQCAGTTTFNVTATGSALSYSWQYRTSASGPWLTVPNAAPYSGVTTNTLTLTNVSSTMNGYQYRALITGPCTAVDFSSPPATLTVTALVAGVSPTSATICTGSIQKIELTNVVSPVNLLEESFNTVSPLPAGWAQQNLSNGLGLTNWFQGNPTVFASNSGAPEAYIAANFNNTTPDGTISNWLFTPSLTVKDGDKFTFYTRAAGTVATRAERLQVRLSTNGASTNVGATATSVGDFTTVLLEVNPLLLPGNANYPNVWTQFTATITGAPTPVTGRIAFRYFVTNGGNVPGINSNFIGIDDVVYTAGGIAQGVWTANPAAPNTMFTDAAATVPYVAGALANAIWVKPTVNTSYSVVYSTTTPCVSAPTTVPVTVVTPVSAPVAPANRTACVGGSVTFTTSATGGPLTYQWQVSTNGGASFTNLANAAGTVAGATTNTLTLSGLTATMNNNQYRAVISAPPCAGSTVNTTAAVLTVNPIPVITIAAPVTQLVPGGSTTITATSTTAGLTYVWSRNGTANGVTGATQFVNIDSLGTYRVTGTLPGVSGCVGQSNSLVIGAQTSDRLWIYPNPTDGQFQVRLYYDAISAPERREFAIFNPQGQQVATRSLDIVRGMSPYVQTNFDLRHLAAGTYVVKVTEKRTGKIVSGLIVIQ